MTAQDLQAEAADAARQAALYRAATDHHTHTGQVFNYLEPLPTMPTHRNRQEWETTDKDTR